MKTFSLALALLCASASTLHAQLDGTDPQYRTLCREALAKPFTPPLSDPTIEPGCDSTIAYFGIGHPVDYRAALACAYVEYAHPTIALSPFPGAGILSMIYANGHGTAPNLDLATRFACESFAAPSEIEARLDILTADRETHSIEPFDLCNTSASANTNDWCTGIEARQSEFERNQAIATFRSSLPSAAIPSFDSLLIAERDFENARILHELDLTGETPAFAGFHAAERIFQARHLFDSPSAPEPPPAPAPIATPTPVTPAPFRLASQLEEQNDLGDRFLADLTLITSPVFNEKTDRRKAEKNLETALKLARVAAPHRLQQTTINYRGIEDAQRIWLNLRDNWLVFITTVNPSPSIADQTTAYITLERARQLNQLIDTAREH